ncbi:hypothetical protein [Streptomyces roseolilacinus]|uniref:Uncharacterized protein n=1 Tax=Streptomyces roseolilacinus TaxID=66904 RepID=A0A918EJI0_9ACTN|nr:hypothetical protein [Streptomyces roseolilacinus]GGP97461.1 hypothetical protein GCM10010249_14950 [Streptomyces roseolilacinus]
MTPVQRITVFTIVLLVVIVLVYIGQPACEAVALVTAAGAAAAQMGPWLSGQRTAAGSAGGA